MREFGEKVDALQRNQASFTSGVDSLSVCTSRAPAGVFGCSTAALRVQGQLQSVARSHGHLQQEVDKIRAELAALGPA
mgnify:CR=1 FL=1